MMSSLRLSALRYIANSSLRSARVINQRRWAQVHDVRFLATTQPPQTVLEKYRAKLDQKAKQEGLGGIDELKAAYADKIDEQRQKNVVDHPVIPQAPETPVKQPNRGPMPLDTDKPQPNPQNPQAPPPSEKAGIKTLNNIIDLPKARELPDKELSAIWRLRHASSPHNLCAIVPTAVYRAMEDAARKAPQFVLPVPHPTQGAEIHFLQWTFDAPTQTSTVLFTQLAEYKQRGEFAQPHTTVTHHLDLADERGLVLMQGQTIENRGVKPEEAKWLVMCLQRFYGGWEAEAKEKLDGERKERAEERKKLLQWFANGDGRFSVDKLLEEAERIG